jgi:hypothetical protein
VLVSVSSCFMLPAGRHTPRSKTSGLLSKQRPAWLLLLLLSSCACAVPAGCWLKPSQPCQCLLVQQQQHRHTWSRRVGAHGSCAWQCHATCRWQNPAGQSMPHVYSLGCFLECGRCVLRLLGGVVAAAVDQQRLWRPAAQAKWECHPVLLGL